MLFLHTRRDQELTDPRVSEIVYFVSPKVTGNVYHLLLIDPGTNTKMAAPETGI